MKILVVGHACSPYAGSEPGLTWNWAWHLAQEHDVWVLAHPHFREPVERYLAEHPNPHLHLVWVAVPPAIDPWRPSRSERGLRLHYLLWLRFAHRRAARLIAAQSIDILHHVCLGTLSAPPRFWKLPVPFIWGPLGGGQSAPLAFQRYFGSDWRRERQRAWRIRLVTAAPAFVRAARNAACVFVTNHETGALLAAAGARDVRLLSDNGIATARADPRPPAVGRDPFTLLWAGRCEPRKGLPLLLETLATLDGCNVRLLVAGDGSKRAEWEARACGLPAGQVTFLGRVAAEAMPALFAQADAFVFTSLQDSLGSVTLEALAQGLPVITLDHQGQGAIIPGSAALKVPVTSPAETVARFAEAIRQLAADPILCSELSRGALSFTRSVLWEERARRVAEVYAEKLRLPAVGAARAGRGAEAQLPMSL